jgi:hypothetical protein
MENWHDWQILLDIELRDAKKEHLLLTIYPAKEKIFNIPIFHHSIIPCAGQDFRPP